MINHPSDKAAAALHEWVLPSSTIQLTGCCDPQHMGSMPELPANLITCQRQEPGCLSKLMNYYCCPYNWPYCSIVIITIFWVLQVLQILLLLLFLLFLFLLIISQKYTQEEWERAQGILTLSRAFCMSSRLSITWPVSCQSTFSSAAAASPLAAASSLFKATAEGGSM